MSVHGDVRFHALFSVELVYVHLLRRLQVEGRAYRLGLSGRLWHALLWAIWNFADIFRLA